MEPSRNTWGRKVVGVYVFSHFVDFFPQEAFVLKSSNKIAHPTAMVEL